MGRTWWAPQPFSLLSGHIATFQTIIALPLPPLHESIVTVFSGTATAPQHLHNRHVVCHFLSTISHLSNITRNLLVLVKLSKKEFRLYATMKTTFLYIFKLLSLLTFCYIFDNWPYLKHYFRYIKL
jgi:hypothetical protein